jgi:hypothetical protein
MVWATASAPAPRAGGSAQHTGGVLSLREVMAQEAAAASEATALAARELADAAQWGPELEAALEASRLLALPPPPPPRECGRIYAARLGFVS